jgi:hypothetical protein
LTDEEEQILKLGPKFIFNDPSTAARRRNAELATLKRKIQRKFFEKKVSPGRPVDQFIAELDLLLQRLHSVPTPPRSRQTLNLSKEHQLILESSFDALMSSRPLPIKASNRLLRVKGLSRSSQMNVKKKSNYQRLVKRLRHKLRSHDVILQKTDKSKVFHLGTRNDYQKKSDEYMAKTQAYQCLGHHDPLPDLIRRTNEYLLQLRLAKWITQKQYELLCVNPADAELAHLYYLPKAHKAGTPLRPIISSLKHPTTKISKFLDDLLRPLFETMAKESTIQSGFELVKQVNQWSMRHLNKGTLLCTMDVADLYTMIPQVEGVLTLRKMLDRLNLKQVNGLKIETIIRLSRFVMKNNYFSYDGQFYHQIRGGAMGSPLTLTIANCYMFFYEQPIVRQVNNSNGLYFRYIDDIFLMINWPQRHLTKQIERWNEFDENIELNPQVGRSIDFLDLHIENDRGKLVTRVYHKPSYEPYYLPFNSIHPMHMKKNIPFAMILRAIRYCSTFQLFIEERESLRVALLLNGYPNTLIHEQFDRALQPFRTGEHEQIHIQNYDRIRQKVISSPPKEKTDVNYETNVFVHFTYCSNMRTFPVRFLALWEKYFQQSPINEVIPVLGTRNVHNLQLKLANSSMSR